MNFIDDILVIIFFVFLYALKYIIFRRQFFTGIPSAFVLYVNNLENLGRPTERAWISYLVKSIFVDGIIAMMIYLIVRTIN